MNAIIKNKNTLTTKSKWIEKLRNAKSRGAVADYQRAKTKIQTLNKDLNIVEDVDMLIYDTVPSAEEKENILHKLEEAQRLYAKFNNPLKKKKIEELESQLQLISKAEGGAVIIEDVKSEEIETYYSELLKQRMYYNKTLGQVVYEDGTIYSKEEIELLKDSTSSCRQEEQQKHILLSHQIKSLFKGAEGFVRGEYEERGLGSNPFSRFKGAEGFVRGEYEERGLGSNPFSRFKVTNEPKALNSDDVFFWQELFGISEQLTIREIADLYLYDPKLFNGAKEITNVVNIVNRAVYDGYIEEVEDAPHVYRIANCEVSDD